MTIILHNLLDYRVITGRCSRWWELRERYLPFIATDETKLAELRMALRAHVEVCKQCRAWLDETAKLSGVPSKDEC